MSNKWVTDYKWHNIGYDDLPDWVRPANIYVDAVNPWIIRLR
jgi:hypothetical protein